MAINKKITELGSKVIEPEDIFIIADETNNYQITMADISGALVGAGPPPGESTYAYFSDFQNNVAGSVTIKEYDAGNNVLQKVISDNFTNFKATLNWDGPGATDYRGTGYIECEEILVANTQETVIGSRNFIGFIDNLNVSTNIPLQLSGEANGVSVILPLEIAGPAPVPQVVRIEAKDDITGPANEPRSNEIYPGDIVDVYAWFDFSSHTLGEQPFEFRLGPHSSQATDPGQHYGADDLVNPTSFAQWNQPWIPHPQGGTDPSFQGLNGTPLSGIKLEGTIRNVANGTIEHGVRVDCRNSYGKVSSSSSFEVIAGGSLDHGLDSVMSAGSIHYFHSHDVGLAPTVNIIRVEYPGISPSDPTKVTTNSTYDQQAIKAGDSAIVENTVADYSSISYESPGDQLEIEKPNEYERFKKVTYKSVGYNVNTNNFKITATKASLSTTKQTCVKIADTPLVLDIKNLDAWMPLKSSPNGNGETFPLQSNQLQLIPPTISVDTSQSPTSVLTRVGTASTNTHGNNFRITVKDIDQKGTFTWQNILGVNLAGKLTTTLKAGDEDYTIGGFTSRQLTALGTDGWKGLYPIGTTVTDPNNVSFVSDATTYNGGVFTYHAFSAGHEIHLAGGGGFNIMYPDNVYVGPSNMTVGPSKFTIVTLKNGPDPSNTTELSFDPNGDHIFILDFGVRSLNFSTHTATAEE